MKMTRRSMERYVGYSGGGKSELRMLELLYGYLPEDKEVTRERLGAWRHSLGEKLTERTVKGYVHAANGYVTYMGHKELRFRQGKPSDLEGRTFGRLTAIEPTGARTPGDPSVRWRCRCACGKETIVPAKKLINGTIRSCGCMRTELLLEKNGYIENTCLKKVFSEKLRADNTSGYTGVFEKDGRWCARIMYKGVNYNLGTYDELDEAVKARRAAEARVKDDARRLLAVWEAQRAQQAAQF